MSSIVPESKQNLPANATYTETARDLLKSLAGARNSLFELFPKPILIALIDLKSLKERVAIKLHQLHVDTSSSMMKITITFDKDRSFQLVGWDQLDTYDWNTGDRTKAIVMTWEFMYQSDQTMDPELHVLSVRVTEALTPMQFLRAAFSRDREDADSLEIKMAPVVCEIDYSDSLLSRELVQLVSEWHKTLRKPVPLAGIGEFIQNYQDRIRQFIDISLEVLIPLAYISAAYIYLHSQFDKQFTTQFFSYGAIIILLFFIVARGSDRFSSYMANSIIRNIDRMGRLPIFELTNGDQNKQTEAFANITSSTYKFWFMLLVSFLINVASTIFTVYVLGIK